MALKDFQASAAALYDGGWRAEDKDQFLEEYNLSPDDADEICELLKKFAE